MSRIHAKGPNKIQFTIWYNNKRYRITVACPSTEADLHRARKQLQEIDTRIADGTFSFAEEFPDFRDLDNFPEDRAQPPPHNRSAPAVNVRAMRVLMIIWSNLLTWLRFVALCIRGLGKNRLAVPNG